MHTCTFELSSGKRSSRTLAHFLRGRRRKVKYDILSPALSKQFKKWKRFKFTGSNFEAAAKCLHKDTTSALPLPLVRLISSVVLLLGEPSGYQVLRTTIANLEKVPSKVYWPWHHGLWPVVSSFKMYLTPNPQTCVCALQWCQNTSFNLISYLCLSWL